jgi:hypothetical protein
MRVRWFTALPTESADDLVSKDHSEEADSTMSFVCYRDSFASSGLTAFNQVGLVRNDRCQPDSSAVIALMKGLKPFHTWADLLACVRRLTA